jgi:AraC-like DNA-binding protein
MNLPRSPGRPRMIRTKASIRKVKHRLEQRKSVSFRKISRDFGISRTSVWRILKNDLGLCAYKIQIEPMLTDEHKEKRT